MCFRITRFFISLFVVMSISGCNLIGFDSYNGLAFVLNDMTTDGDMSKIFKDADKIYPIIDREIIRKIETDEYFDLITDAQAARVKGMEYLLDLDNAYKVRIEDENCLVLEKIHLSAKRIKEDYYLFQLFMNKDGFNCPSAGKKYDFDHFLKVNKEHGFFVYVVEIKDGYIYSVRHEDTSSETKLAELFNRFISNLKQREKRKYEPKAFKFLDNKNKEITIYDLKSVDIVKLFLGRYSRFLETSSTPTSYFGIARKNQAEDFRFYKGLKKTHSVAKIFAEKGKLDKKQFSENLKKNSKGLKEAARLGIPGAQAFLGEMYLFGYGIDKDHIQAVEWLVKATASGNRRSQFNLGLAYDYGAGVSKNTKTAISWYEKSAKQNYQPAQMRLAVHYLKGDAVEKSDKKAAQWFRRAAELGNAEAQYHLGDLYDYGRGVKQDKSVAIEWYTKAAEQGYADAQTRLGFRYSKGEGVEEDEAAAIVWFLKAAKQGSVRAQYMSGVSYKYGLGVSEDQKIAIEWFKKAAEQKFEYAQYQLGLAYEEGLGVLQDDRVAIKWYREAAKQGNKKAKEKLLWLTNDPSTFPSRQDIDDALQYVRKIVRG